MRILLQSESYWPNKDGGAVFEHWLAHRLVAAGHKVAILAPGQKARAYVEKDGETTIFRTPAMPLPLNTVYKITYFAKTTAEKAVREFRPDVIHCNTMWLSSNSLLKIARREKIPIVATNHLQPVNVLLSLPKFIKNSRVVDEKFWRVLVRFHNRFDAVTSPTPSATKLLRDFGLTKPLYDISNGIDVDFYQPLAKPSAASRDKRLAKLSVPDDYILYFGRVNKEKRLDMLMKSFAKIAPKTTADLVIAGKGNDLENMQDLARNLGVGGRVHFVGFISDEEKLALAQHAKLFAITSPAELQSIVCLEAMACGLPLVAVDIVALKELCLDGKNGFLVQLDDEDGLTKALLTILNNDKLRARFGQFSRDFVVKHHASEETLRKFIKLYECAMTGEFPAKL